MEFATASSSPQSRCQKPQRKHQRSSGKSFANVHGLHLLKSLLLPVPALMTFTSPCVVVDVHLIHQSPSRKMHPLVAIFVASTHKYPNCAPDRRRRKRAAPPTLHHLHFFTLPAVRTCNYRVTVNLRGCVFSIAMALLAGDTTKSSRAHSYNSNSSSPSLQHQQAQRRSCPSSEKPLPPADMRNASVDNHPSSQTLISEGNSDL
ncbi:hypothetical protein DEO72_LG5g2390 [Vigna unguiculata]|uniref:Uncharacterized protein n=1 Tax=Vigna unguiculata TaxID=3917 RepID=A0A4D6M096_VIGUN|nr:hypothetical protein DEO72_LG5g2390 [Vigna unguiculata]